VYLASIRDDNDRDETNFEIQSLVVSRKYLSKTLNLIALAIRPLIPESRWGDRLIALLDFVMRHRRVPTREPLFNDVLYQIKVGDEILDSLRVFVSDKEFLKLYVKGIVGDRHNVPTIAVIRSTNELESFRFPDNCVIKPTHASGQKILRQNGGEIPLETVKGWFALNFYRVAREANYKTLKPKIIVEPVVEFASTEYRVFCLYGIPKLIKTKVTEEDGRSANNFFDLHWNELEVETNHPRSMRELPRPENLPDMLSLTAKLSAGFSLVRIDLYSDGREIWVSEITNCDNAAGTRFYPASAEHIVSKILFG
jgi:hypothetical protein